MPFTRRQFLYLAGSASLASVLPAIASAQFYPAHPVRVIVPYAAGGPNDTIARILTQKLSENWHQQFYVENIPTGAGNVGTVLAARSPPDGYSVVVVTSSFFINPGLYAKAQYDPVKDFAPVTLLAAAPHVLVVHPSFPAADAKGFVSAVRANPGKYSYASAGVGQSSHLVGEWFKLCYNLDLVHVPFNGAAPAMTSTMGGHTPVAFISLPAAAAGVKDGRLRALAVTSAERSRPFPDIPTMEESGFPSQESMFMQGLLFPAGTPKDIVDRWYREVAGIVAMPDVTEHLQAVGFEPVVNTPEDFGAQIKAEVAHWRKILREARIGAVE